MILVTGAMGQLGQSIQFIHNKNYSDKKVIFFNSEEWDITSESVTESIFTRYPEATTIINTAAYTNVDQAEDESLAAMKINALGPYILAKYTKLYRKKLVHISTDYVFDGTANKPYTPTFKTNPVSEYGRTKAAGELLTTIADPNTIIVRTSWVYSQFGKNFLLTMQRLMSEKKQLSIVKDQTGCPTSALSLAEFLLSQDFTNKSGIYHFSNAEETTWYDFACAIARELKKNIDILPTTSDQYPSKVKRPDYSVLNCDKTWEDFDIEGITWKNALKQVISYL